MENELKELHEKLLDMLIAFQDFTKKHDLEFFLVGGSALGAFRHKGMIPWDDDIDIAMMRSDFEKMERAMEENDNILGKYLYSSVEKHMFPEAPIGFLYELEEQSRRINAKIDIHPIDGVPESSLARKVQKIASLVYYLSVYRLPVKNKGKMIRGISKIILRLTPKALFQFYQKICKRFITKWSVEQSENICSLFGVQGYEQEVMPKNYVLPLKMAVFETTEFPMPGNPDAYLKRLYGNYMELPPEEQRHPQVHYNGYRT